MFCSADKYPSGRLSRVPTLPIIVVLVCSGLLGSCAETIAADPAPAERRTGVRTTGGRTSQ